MDNRLSLMTLIACTSMLTVFNLNGARSEEIKGTDLQQAKEGIVELDPSQNNVEQKTGFPEEISKPSLKVQSVKLTKRGIASWYGPGFHGRLTANGERFNSNNYTAAHKTLPFGTKVRVTNIGNGRSVMVRINDRGPFIRGREIDLSAQAARVLDISGIAPVKLEVISF